MLSKVENVSTKKRLTKWIAAYIIIMLYDYLTAPGEV